MDPRKALAWLLSAALILPATATNPAPAKLTRDQQIAHALDRLTFGARPGDVERVRKMGLDRWIDQQLHPEQIAENPALERMLAPLAALQMSQTEIFRRYPPNAVLAAVVQRGAALPETTDPFAKKAMERAIERYKARKSAGNKEEAKATPVDLPKIREEVAALVTPAQFRTLRGGKPDEKRAVLATLTPAQTDQLLLALPPGMLQGLMPVATPDMRRKIVLLSTPQQVIAYDLNEAKLLRAIYSNRQLNELLVDFWFNHFNVYLDKGADRHLVPSYERDAIRPQVFGNFRDLLAATAQHPAMLFYLDNFQSMSPDSALGQRQARRAQSKRGMRGLNENYARELLELHTLGVEGGYTQKDIIEVARCFTGWTMKAPRTGGGFQFVAAMHDPGEKTVLGVKIPAGGGKSDGEKVLDILVRHPSTAQFVAKKLAMRFVADDPPAELVARMAQTFQRTNGDLRAVYECMLRSKEFFAGAAFRAKVKTPLELVVSATRALNADVETAYAMAQQLNQMGQPLYRKQEPTGYSAKNSEWVSSSALLGRMNFALSLAQNQLPGVRVDAAQFGGNAESLASRWLPVPLSPETKATIAKALSERKDAPVGLLAGLVLGSPEFQRR
jgi:uncharacterized protein (DUF1800 family)